MKKILLTFNSLNDANGVARCAMAIANILAKEDDVEVSIRPLYRCDSESIKKLDSRIKVKPVFGFYFRGMSKILSLIPAKWLYNTIFRKESYDIEIAFQFGIATYIIGASGISSHSYKLAWMHGYDENLVFRDEYLRMDKVVCVSKCNRDRLAKDLSNEDLVDYCYNPINDSEIVNMGKEPISLKPNNNIQFVSVGRLNKEKGYGRLIDCMKKLIDNGYNCSLWIIGPGAELGELTNKIHSLKLEDYIVLTGGQENPNKYTAKADVFVCSSYSEGYSTACTESILLGVPVITTPVSGSEEIISSAQCGLISKDLETESLYQIMEQVLINPEMVAEWKNTLKHSKIAFTQAVRKKKLFDLLGI